jgi:hypothetical protein
MKKLNGKPDDYPNGAAEFDTGASYLQHNCAFQTHCLEGCTFCYVDHNFVKDFYACIPGVKTLVLGSGTAAYNMIPAEFTAAPSVELDIGGHLFALEHVHLPRAMKHDIENKPYFIGAIQPKTL